MNKGKKRIKNGERRSWKGKERKGKVKYKQMKSSLNSCQLHGTLSQKKK
jgi:hypothetical protein